MFKRLKPSRTSFILAVSTILFLSGCSIQIPAYLGGNILPGQPDAVSIESSTSTSSFDTSTIGVVTVQALKAICSNLGEFISDPSNWKLSDNNNGSAPFEAYVEGGDGGAVVLLVSPGSPRAALSVSPDYLESTNALLYYQGCTSITTEPDISVEPLAGETSTVETFVLPNLVGYTENQIRDWSFKNRINAFITSSNHGNNPYGPCVQGGYGPVTAQSVAAGTVLVNSTSTHLYIDVDCERTHWVQDAKVNQ